MRDRPGAASSQRRILVLGGTTQAREIAQQLTLNTGLRLWYALAGRTRQPHTDGIPAHSVISGSLGGTDGLARFLRERRVDALIDATHPFAQNISRNALEAARREAVPLARFERAPWAQLADDNWHFVASTEAAIRFLLQTEPALCYRNVLLTIGAAELPVWCEALGTSTQDGGPEKPTVFARSIEAPACEMPANFTNIRARGPFTLAAESELLSARRIDLIISKLSGGSSGYAKVLAARQHGIPMLMIEPPALPATLGFDTVADMVRWATKPTPRTAT